MNDCINKLKTLYTSGHINEKWIENYPKIFLSFIENLFFSPFKSFVFFKEGNSKRKMEKFIF